MSNEPMVWLWRTLPRWTLDDDLATGMQPTEPAAMSAAEAALRNPKAIAALICPVGLMSGKWIALAKPSIGLPSQLGTVRWFDPVTATWRDIGSTSEYDQ